jgi:cellobionic acid phosphorylase
VKEGIHIDPKLPSHWGEASVIRYFREAELQIEIRRESGIKAVKVYADGKLIDDGILKGVEAGKVYRISVKIPKSN